MKIVEPSVEIYREKDHLRKIETIARICTGTQEKTGSRPGFVHRLIERGHTSVLEHVRVVITSEKYLALRAGYGIYGFIDRIEMAPSGEFFFINARDFLAIGGTLDDLVSMPESEDCMTVKFVCDIGISRELCRHRRMSFTERSTRYVNMKDGIEFVRPVPFEWSESGNADFNVWKLGCERAELFYKKMIGQGLNPQEARTVMPLSAATVIYVSGMYSQWRALLKLRTAHGAHPQMRHLMKLLLSHPDCPDEVKNYADLIKQDVKNEQ